ncbi:MAG: hypothetical protein V5B33_19105 [Candidatus Accumulibacter sp. UW20]|jgi:hypothetical protein
MATIVDDSPFHERRTTERRRYPGQAALATWADNAFRVSWGGIWAGVLAAVGVLLLLTALGLAIGISAVDFQDPDAGALGIGAIIWAALSLLVALFVGGFMSTRLAMITDKSTGLYEGALVWVLSIILTLYLAASGVGTLAGGAFNLVSASGRSVATLTGFSEMELSQTNVDQIIGRLQDPATAQEISRTTGVPVLEVRNRLQQTAQAVENVRSNPAEVAAEVRRNMAALMSHPETRERMEQASQTSAWAAFFALLLSLWAAVGGAAIGRRRARDAQTQVASRAVPSA